MENAAVTTSDSDNDESSCSSDHANEDTSGSETGSRSRQSSGDSNPDQRRVIWTYKVLCTIQAVAGVGVIGSSSLAFWFDQGSRLSGVPYQIGGYFIGATLMCSAALAFCVWQKGPRFHADVKARRRVICAIHYHRVTSLCMFLVSIVGMCILLMFGMCLQNDEDCSYDKHVTAHRTIATISLVFGFLGIVTSSVGIMLIRQFGSAFGIETTRSRPPVTTVSRSVEMVAVGTNNSTNSEAQRELDMQRQREMQLSPFAVLSSPAGGVMNSAFEPPQLPPYTPPETAVSMQQPNENGSDMQLPYLSKHGGNQVGVSQSDAVTVRPPPYAPPAHSPSIPVPSYSADISTIPTRDASRCSQKVISKIQKYMVSQID